MQVPDIRKVAVVPLTVQTLAVLDAKLTVNAGALVVPISVSGVPTVCVPGLAKVIVCGVNVLLSAAVCEEVAANVPV